MENKSTIKVLNLMNKKNEIKLSHYIIPRMLKPTTCVSQYKDLNEFLAKHSAKNVSVTTEHKIITHTRIPDVTQNIHAGAYIVPAEELPIFHSLYYSHIFEHKKKEYLTERQLESGGPMAIDFDFRYEHSVTERQHTESHIIDMLNLYLEELKQHFVLEEGKPFAMYVFEKPKVNRLQDGSLTKDGIHVLFGIQVPHIIQCMIRDKMLVKLPEYIDLPLINTWESVLDEGISKGHTNWQLFGSRKPGHDAYELTQIYTVKYLKDEGGVFEYDQKKVSDFNMKTDFVKLSVQYTGNPVFEIHPNVQERYDKLVENKKNKVKKAPSKNKINLLSDDNDNEMEEEGHISIHSIQNAEMLEKAVNQMLKKLSFDEQEIRELHEYTQALPARFYEPGSHTCNRQVAFALKHTDDRLFLSWVMLRSKASDFDYNDIPNLYGLWKKFQRANNEGKVVTGRSIKYWVKNENPEEFEKIKSQTCDYFVQEAVKTNTESDYARVLKHLYGDLYTCVSYNNKGIWYKFQNHRWVQDKKLSLREKISTELYNLFGATAEKYESQAGEYEDGDDRKKYLSDLVRTIQTIKINLKKTTFKDHVMREAAEQMYDDNFMRNADTNKYLLGFNNGVVDFANKVFREGYPEDYITKTTRIDYVPCDESDPKWMESRNALHEFMHSLFPIEELETYMWDHLSSCLIGTNKNQTFHIYHGSGSNGKSLMVDLMGASLGEYKGTVPITLVTDARGKIGGTSDEILKLKGVRYAVMQEPNKSVKLNEGIMKEMTGSDPIQARGLYAESEIFTPQFKLAVGTNSLFDIESNDDGTWRRIRKVTFPSKFVDDNEYFEDDTTFVFKKDKSLDEKLHVLAPVFAGMLVKRAFENDGIVKECAYVMDASKKYRSGQDHIAAFISEKIRKVAPGTNKSASASGIKKVSLLEEFKLWYQQEHGSKKMPKSEELYEAVSKRFKMTAQNNKMWIGLEFIREEEEEDALMDAN